MAGLTQAEIIAEIVKSSGRVQKHELVGDEAKHEHKEIEAGDVGIETGMDDGADMDQAKETEDSAKLKVPDVQVDDAMDLAKASPKKQHAQTGGQSSAVPGMSAKPSSQKPPTPVKGGSPDGAAAPAAKAPAAPEAKAPPAPAAKAPDAKPAAQSPATAPTPEPPAAPDESAPAAEGDGEDKKKKPNPFAKSDADDAPETVWKSGWFGPKQDADNFSRALRFQDVRARRGYSPYAGLASLEIHVDDLSKAQSLGASLGIPERWLKSAAGDSVGGTFKAMEDAKDTDDDNEEGEVEPDEDDTLAVGSPLDGMVVMQYPDGSLSGQLSAGDEVVGHQLEARRRAGLFSAKSGTSEGAKRGWETRNHGIGHKYEDHPDFDPERNSGGQPDTGKNKVVYKHEGIYGYKQPIPVHEVNDWKELPEGQETEPEPEKDEGSKWRNANSHNTRNTRHIYTAGGKLYASQFFGQEAPAGHQVEGWVHDHDKTVSINSPAHFGDKPESRQSAISTLKGTIAKLHQVGLPRDYNISIDLGDQIGTHNPEYAYHLLSGGRLPANARRMGMSGKREKSAVDFVTAVYKAGNSEGAKKGWEDRKLARGLAPNEWEKKSATHHELEMGNHTAHVRDMGVGAGFKVSLHRDGNQAPYHEEGGFTSRSKAMDYVDTRKEFDYKPKSPRPSYDERIGHD